MTEAKTGLEPSKRPELDSGLAPSLSIGPSHTLRFSHLPPFDVPDEDLIWFDTTRRPPNQEAWYLRSFIEYYSNFPRMIRANVPEYLDLFRKHRAYVSAQDIGQASDWELLKLVFSCGYPAHHYWLSPFKAEKTMEPADWIKSPVELWSLPEPYKFLDRRQMRKAPLPTLIAELEMAIAESGRRSMYSRGYRNLRTKIDQFEEEVRSRGIEGDQALISFVHHSDPFICIFGACRCRELSQFETAIPILEKIRDDEESAEHMAAEYMLHHYNPERYPLLRVALRESTLPIQLPGNGED